MLNSQVRSDNQTVLDGLTSEDTYVQKEAKSAVGEYLHLRAREDSLSAKILPPTPVTWDDMDNQVDTVKPVIIREMEPTSKAAVTMPFGGVPSNVYMGAKRYRIMFDRTVGPRYGADVNNLRGYTMDIRQVFNDLMLVDLLHEKDRKFFAVADSLCGTVNEASGLRYETVGTKGYIKLGGAISRGTLQLLAEGLVSTDHKLDAHCLVMNQKTAKQFISLDRTAFGGDGAEENLIKGISTQTVLGYKLITTNKYDLVAHNDVYLFAEPKFLGDNLVLQDITVSIKNEDYMMEMFAYDCSGGALANLGAFCRATFSGTEPGTW